LFVVLARIFEFLIINQRKSPNGRKNKNKTKKKRKKRRKRSRKSTFNIKKGGGGQVGKAG